MQDLIHNFGIDGYLLTAQIVNFLIILYILKRFAYKPILAMLEKRKKLIEEGQKQTKEAAEALEKAIAKEKEILKNAHNESKILLADATKQADGIITKAHESGKQQVEKMISDAREQIAQDRKATEKELATKVAALAVDMLRSSLTGLIDKEDEAKILEKTAKELKKSSK